MMAGATDKVTGRGQGRIQKVAQWASGGAQRRSSSPILCPLPHTRVPCPHVHVHIRRPGYHHRHLSLPRLLRTLQIPQCPQLQGVGRRGWLRAEAPEGTEGQGDGWDLRAGATGMSKGCGVTIAAEGKGITPTP